MRRSASFVQRYRADFDNDKHNGKHVDLSFYNLPKYGTMAEYPNKIIFDKNDPTAAMLPVIYPAVSYVNYAFFRDNVL
jgi:hypothetical protein